MSAERFAEVDHITEPLRALPYHWVPSLRPGFATAITEYVSWLTKLYAAIAHISGASIIVETSKDPGFASLLTQLPGNNVHIVHLVRDSRAVAYSWTRTKRLPSPIGEQIFMPQFKPRATAARWLVANTAFHALATRQSSYIRIPYENFVANPRETLRKFSAFAGESLNLPTSQLTDNKVRLGDHHIFSGNPMRANTGWLEIHLDDEWQTMLPPSQFAEVTAITWPLLHLYGYPAVPTARRELIDSSRAPSDAVKQDV